VYKRQRTSRSPRGPRVQETTGQTSGVPITKADWSYREELVDDGGLTGAPSKRQIKHRSGRAGRRMYRNQQWLRSVGGYANMLDAIAAPPDKELCVVVDSRRGFKADGTPNREWR